MRFWDFIEFGVFVMLMLMLILISILVGTGWKSFVTMTTYIGLDVGGGGGIADRRKR